MEVRCALDGGETWPRWRWGTYIGALVESWYLDVGQTRILGPGCRWERTWKHLTSTFWDLGLRVWGDLKAAQMQFSGPGWRGEINLGAWLGVRCKSWDLAEGEMGHGLGRDSHLETWIRCNGTTSRIQLSWPGLTWDVTWIVVRCEYRDLHGRGKGEGEMRIFVLRWNLNGTQKGVTQESWGLNAGDTGPGWRWYANLCTLMEVRWYTDRVYASILGFGFLWDRTWMEVRCTFLKPGWVWDDAWIGVKYILGGLGWRWFIILKEVGGKYANLDWGETRHGRRETWILESKWSWNADHETWMGWDGTRI